MVLTQQKARPPARPHENSSPAATTEKGSPVATGTGVEEYVALLPVPSSPLNDWPCGSRGVAYAQRQGCSCRWWSRARPQRTPLKAASIPRSSPSNMACPLPSARMCALSRLPQTQTQRRPGAPRLWAAAARTTQGHCPGRRQASHSCLGPSTASCWPPPRAGSRQAAQLLELLPCGLRCGQLWDSR